MSEKGNCVPPFSSFEIERQARSAQSGHPTPCSRHRARVCGMGSAVSSCEAPSWRVAQPLTNNSVTISRWRRESF
jgi:hypothetical protein